MCGLSPVVTPAGACLQTYREIYFNAYSTWDDNNNNNCYSVVCLSAEFLKDATSRGSIRPFVQIG